MTLREQVEAAMPAVRARVAAHGVHIKLVNAREDGVVEVVLRGNSVTCPMAQTTLSKGILQSLKRDIPQVTDVISVDA